MILETPCWEWQGATFRKGYGNFRVSRSQNMGAHRYMYEHTVGPIPEGLFLLHKCDNPPCVRPSHMFVGTQRDNIRDMWAKKREGDYRNFGPKNGSTKLTETEVREIRKLFVKRRSGHRIDNRHELAALYRVTTTTIMQIIQGKIWKHLE